jgi:hypothetical protein
VTGLNSFTESFVEVVIQQVIAVVATEHMDHYSPDFDH